MGYSNKIVKTTLDVAVTLTEIKDHINIDQEFKRDDRLLLTLISAATDEAEKYVGHDIVLKDNILKHIDFYGKNYVINEVPFKSITSIKTTKNGVETELVPDDDYTVKIKYTYFEIIFTETLDVDKIEFLFKTGNELSKIPATESMAIMVKTADLYDFERSSHIVGVNQKHTNVFERLLSSSRIDRW